MKFKSYEKNTLRGFFTVRLTQVGLEIKDATLHEKGGSRWIGLPSKSYQDENGDQKWSRIIDFYDEKKGKEFKRLCLEVLDKFQSGEGNGSNKKS